MAFNWGGAGAGAIGGFTAGSAIGGPPGAGIGLIAGGIMGGLSGNADQGGGYQYFEPQAIIHPQYSFTEPRLNLTSDFISQNIERMMAGEFPAYYQSAIPQIRESMERPLRQMYGFGGYGGGQTGGGGGGGSWSGGIERPYGPTIMDMTREQGAATGAGPKATMAATNKAMMRYEDKMKAIDEMITKMGVDITTRDAVAFPQLSSQMPKGPDVTIMGPHGFAIGGSGGSGMSELMGALGNANLPNMSEGMGNWWNSMFGPKDPQQQTPTSNLVNQRTPVTPAFGAGDTFGLKDYFWQGMGNTVNSFVGPGSLMGEYTPLGLPFYSNAMQGVQNMWRSDPFAPQQRTETNNVALPFMWGQPAQTIT